MTATPLLVLSRRGTSVPSFTVGLIECQVANSRNYLFSRESVSEGHPDKVCDRISDAVVDLYMAADPHSRVAIETLVTTNRIVMAGEVRGPAISTVVVAGSLTATVPSRSSYVSL